MTLVKDVFVAGGMPSTTYVDRTVSAIERSLRDEIREGYKVICVTGPTKSGKTVLARHVLGPDSSAIVNGGQVEKSGEFWQLLLEELNLPDTETTVSEDELSAGMSYIFSAQKRANEGISQTFSNANKRKILGYMTESNLSLVVDDFHYMPSDVQREIVRTLKSEVFEGLTAILIAVPHRAFDAISAEREMEGRFAHIEIPTWELSELATIASKGFSELKMKVSPDCISNFTKESQGSPLLMQRFCSRLCLSYDITKTCNSETVFNPSDEKKEAIFEAVAKQFGFPTFEKLSKGPQSRSKRMDRKLLDGSGSVDIYQSVLQAVANTGPKEKIPYNEIREELRKMLVETDVPQKHEVSLSLGQMSGIAKNKIQGEPVLEWSDDFLYLTDPLLMFYMRWSKRTNR